MERSRVSADAVAILARRARQLAHVEVTASEQEGYTTVVLVRLGKERLGLPAQGMQGVYEDVRITPVMGTPPWIAGVAQVRGELMSVVHLSRWLGQAAAGDRPVIAVLRGREGTLGILVDEVIGSHDVRPTDVSDLLTRQAHREKRPISVVTNDLVAVLDVERFLADPELIVGQGATTDG
ncbi:MAG: chemotaxis protein CheW [Polyangiaceae bacterium]|nr:chemotaxis protein CheW [Polyangiaceae bacterium]